MTSKNFWCYDYTKVAIIIFTKEGAPMSKSTSFDYKAHNQKIASLRGKDWKRKLSIAKPKESLLALVRCQKGFTQVSILPHLGIKTQTSYARIERGEVLVPKERAEKIAKVLNTKSENLFWQPEPNKYLALPGGGV